MARYLRPTALPDALALLAAAPLTILAGGTDHYPARVQQARHEDILDITALPDLRRIEAAEDHWRIPCLVTWSDLIAADLPPLFDALKHAARQVGGRQIQNAATLAGNLCNASPAADSIPCLLAMNASVELSRADGVRVLPVEAFVLGSRRTARRPDELVTAILVPRPVLPARSGFHKLGGRRYLVISIVMIAAMLEMTPDGRCAEARIAVGACGAVATRLTELEQALIGARPSSDCVQPVHLAPLAPITDMRATAGYRDAATLVMLRRLIGALA